jgi:amino acid transporter
MTVPTPAPHPGYWTPNNTAPRLGTPGRAPGNTFAWIGLIISISGFVFPVGINGLLGAAFSIMGLREARRLQDAGQTETGRSIAQAGLVVGIVHILVTIGLIVLAVFAFTWFTEWIDGFTAELHHAPR